MNINDMIFSYYNDNLTFQEKLEVLDKIKDKIEEEKNSIKLNVTFCPKCNQYYQKDSFKCEKIKCKKLILLANAYPTEIPQIKEDYLTKIICPCGHSVIY